MCVFLNKRKMKKKNYNFIGLFVLGLCVVLINGACKEGSVPCRTGAPACVASSQQHDGRIDCTDGSDEGCQEGWFICKDRKSCLETAKVQDGVPDCADASDEECGPLQHRCVCAPHRCVDAENLKDGIKDCEDGSDEVEVIDIKSDCPKLVNITAPVIRNKRRASDVSTRIDGPVTTSMFLGDENTATELGIRTRPTGLLTSTVGTFIQQGTTTEFATKVFGTHVDGHYAKIISTSSRVFFAIPSPAAGDALGGVRPTGLISSVTATKISGLATTLHTTDYYRTYIDGTYAQLVSSYSRVVYPSTHTILATNAYNSIQSGQIYQTALNSNNDIERQVIDVSPINSKPIDRIFASKASSMIKSSGSFKPNNDFSVVFGDSKFGPSAVNEDVVTITGTHGAYVNAPAGNEETTYNVFTGTYVRDSKTYLFFFGNSALGYNPSSVNIVHATSIPEQQELVIKSGGIPGKRIVVSVDKELNLLIPKQALSHAVAGSGEIDGSDMGGVFIEGSEDISGFSVHGAHRSRNNVATEMLTVTIGKNVAHTKILRDNIQTTSVKPGDRTVYKFLPMRERLRQGSSSRVTSSTSHHIDEENDNLLKARKIDSSFLRPSKPKINLPTYTVGHDLDHGSTFAHEDTTEVVFSVNKSVEAFIGGRPRKDFKFLSTSNRPRPGKSFRNFQVIHDKEDLQHVESQHATVTYVGFADFTTTVGNTVIVFMPHTKASSQQPKSITPNLKVTTLSDAIVPTVAQKTVSETTRMMTKVKTFFSNTPGMVTKTVTGHTLSMQTSLPTMLVSPQRTQKELSHEIKIDEIASEYEDMRSKVLVEEQVDATHVVDDEISSELKLSSYEIEPSVTFDEYSSDLIASSIELELSSSLGLDDLSSAVPDLSSVIPTQPLSFATTETLLYNTVDQYPIGLVKSIGGTEAYNGTTTIFTSLIYGTRIDGKYAQIIQTTSSIFYRPDVSEFIVPTKSSEIPTIQMTVTTEESIQSTTDIPLDTTTEGTTVELLGTTISDTSAENELISENDLGRKVNSNPQDQVIADLPMSSILAKGAPPAPVEESSTIQYVTKVIPSTVYKTYTYFTTFFIPDGLETSTSVKSREVTTSDITLSTSLVDIREILASAVTQFTTPSTTLVIDETTTEGITDTTNVTPETPSQDTTINEITTNPTTPLPETEEEEIELIFKTQYTTYTYLTTYFHDTSSSVSSREEVVTNIITSTLDPGSVSTDPAVAGLFAREDSIVSSPYNDNPTSVGVGRPTTKFFSAMNENEMKPTARLAPSETELFTIQDQPDSGIKTYFTTYTYFTTIFVDGETTVSSRTEVYSNVISPTSIQSTATQSSIEVLSTLAYTKLASSKDEDVIVSKSAKAINSANYANKYSTAIRNKHQKEEIELVPENTTPKDLITASSDTLTTSEVSELTTEASTAEISTEATSNNLVTQELPSGPSGPTGPSGLDDQISLESNMEIDPSPTLLLQTSYTTFTYFTTLYKGTTSEIISRLETVTNVATETISPASNSILPAASQENNELDASSVQEVYPITYFTTFTYWTTAYKDGSTVVTSREETVSNVVTPTNEIADVSVSLTEAVEPTNSIVVTPTPVLGNQPTTFYTTFTYFTTSYVGESTVISSRLETETNIVTNSPEENTISPSQTGRAIGSVAPKEQLLEISSSIPVATPVLLPTGLISTIRSSTVNDGTTTLLSTDVYGTYIDGLYAKVLESSTQILTDITPTPSVNNVQKTGVVSLNVGSIVDVEGITTTYYTTKAVGTYIGNLYAQVVESSTSLHVDPDRTPEPSVASRTGLVRLIEGSIVKDDVTTVYESRVIGTVVDGRYAQIIESTSNYQSSPSPTSTLSTEVKATQLISSSVPVLESSISDTTGHDDEHDEEHKEGDEEQEDDDEANSGGKGRIKSRLTFQSRKRTFTPVIRPFVSRNRPTFNPRLRQTSATTITRTTVTPTVTAIPATAAGGSEGSTLSRGRFNNRRVSSTGAASSNNVDVRPTSSRKFARGKISSTSGGYAPSSSSGYNSVSGRRSSSGRISATSAASYPFSSSSRRGGAFSGGRSSYSTAGRGSSSSTNPSIRGTASIAASSRFRIRPTSSLPFLARTSSLLTSPSPDVNDNTLRDNENDVTEVRTEQDEAQNTDFTDTTNNETPTPVTEATSFKRPPPFKLRRPPIPTRAPTTTTVAPRTTSAARRFSLRRPAIGEESVSEKKSERSKYRASTTTTPAPTRSIATRPNRAQTLRQRPTSSLFPPRGLFRRPGDEDETGVEESKTSDEEKNVEENSPESKPAVEEEVGDNDYEASEPVSKSVNKQEAPKVQIRPFSSRLLRRSRRQTEYGSRGGTSLASRFRRPSAARKTVVVEEEEEIEPEPVTPAPKPRYSPRSRNQQTQVPAPRVRPTATTGRSQFTLTNNNNQQSRNFRRPASATTASPAARKRRPDSSVQRPTAPRLRTQKADVTSSRGTSRRFNNNNAAASTSSRTRGSSRRRYNDFDYADSPYSPSTFDGTITVTHKVPTEVTIPVINGKITEYKQVIRNTPSIEVLGPNQYSSTEIDGSSVLVINNEITATPAPGVTEVTQFILRETPTTSVTFTPTNIRGRKTSFSHIVPSTVYDVEPVVNTISDSLSPSAPLANLLLSQLLLGNFNLGQQNINPLLGLNQQPAAPATPTTEFKTRSTTYVTTVTDLKSTVIPITLRGKSILTTIIDSSVDVITATEYITETIIVTPTQSNNQINSLLLPALLQAQLYGQQQQPQQQSNPLLQLQQAQLLQQQQQLAGHNNKPKESEKSHKGKYDDDSREDLESDDDPRNTRDSDFDVISKEELSEKSQPPVRKKPKIAAVPVRQKETSIVTLYVSGRKPGEFSTVLSTVITEVGASLVKREAISPPMMEIYPSAVLSNDIPEPDLDLYLMSALNDIEGSELNSSTQETQSLESILGDITKHIDPSITALNVGESMTAASSPSSPNSQTGHFLSQGSVELAPLIRKARSTQNRGNVDEIPSTIDEKTTPRRRIRVRVPVRKVKSDDLTLSEAQYPGFNEKSPNYNPLYEGDHFDNKNTRTTPTTSENINSAVPRKRIVITRRKKLDASPTAIETSTTEEILPKTSRRRKIVTLKRPVITTAAPEIKPTSTRHRIVITKKRPVSKQVTDEQNEIVATSTAEILETEKTTSSALSLVTKTTESAVVEQAITKTSTSEILSTEVLSTVVDIETTTELESSIETTTAVEVTSSSELLTTPTLIETSIEDESTYDGPKFVRPTRFSVTHKPSDDFIKRIQSARTNAKIILPSRRNTHTRNTPSYLSKSKEAQPTSITTYDSSSIVDTTVEITPVVTDDTSTVETSVEITPTPSTQYATHTVTETKLKTFTYVVTRVNGDEKLVTTTHEVKPVVSTVTLTEIIQPSAATPVVASTPVLALQVNNDGEGSDREARMNIEEARMNLATRIMSNGVEVIVADRSTEALRIAPSSLRPVTLAPSTLTDQMVLDLPEHEPQASLISSLRSDTAKFVTRTQQTTYTYLTTFVKGGRTITSSREEVIANKATDEPNRLNIAPTKTINHHTITTGYDKASYDTSTFHTTYTYLNTILDGEVPVVVTSKETLKNTVTGLFDPTQLQSSEPEYDTNTYFNTYTFTKTLKDENGGKFTSKHRNIVTQVVITEAPTLLNKVQATQRQSVRPTATTDIVKTYFVTYTYFSTFLEKGSTVIKTNIATSSDIVTEKFYLSPKRTPLPESTKISAEIDIAPTTIEPLKVFATKTYLTTFTYFTTLLQGKSTVTSSSTKLVYNVVTEAITTGLDSLYLDSLRSSFAAQTSREPIVTTVMLAGEALEITAVQPTAPKDAMLNTASTNLSPSFEHVVTGSTIIFIEDETTTAANKFVTPSSSINISPQVFTGASTVFFNDEKTVNNTDTPEFLLSSLESGAASVIQPEFLTSTIAASTVISNQNGPATTLLPGDKVVLLTRPDGNVTMIPVSDPTKKRPTEETEEENDEDNEDDDEEDGDLKVSAGSGGPVAAEIGVSDLLNLGQFGFNGLNALGPVINAMAGLIQSNLNTGQAKRNTTVPVINKPNKPFPEFIQPKTPANKQPILAQREPVYIPVGSLANSAHLISEKHVPGFAESVRPDLPPEDNENAGSAWIDSLPIQGNINERIPLMDRPPQSQIVLGRPTMESPILQDGIPIQPGQVITANSDVIVGKPSVLGPRPRPGSGPGPSSGPVLPPADRRPPQGRPNDVIHQQIPNDIYPPQPQIQYQPKPNVPKINQAKPNQGSNTPIGMRPPPLPAPHHQNFNPTKVISGAQTVFLGNRFPQTPVNQGQHQHPAAQHVRPNIHPSFVQNIIDRSTGTIRPSKPLIIQGASTQFFGPDGRPIINEPIPLPETEPGFIGVSNIGVSDQHVHHHHHHYDNEDHIIMGTVGEPPAGPQHLGEVILEIPDTMPVLQPGSKLKFPVSSESENSGVQFSDLNGNRPHFDNQAHSQTHRPQFENNGQNGNIHRPQFENNGQNGNIHRPQFDNNGPIQRPQIDNGQHNGPVPRPQYENNQNHFQRPPFDNNRVPGAPNSEQTPIDMRPPPMPHNNSPPKKSQRPNDSPYVHFVPPPTQSNYQGQNRPISEQGPVVIPFNQHHRPSGHHNNPNEIHISPNGNNWNNGGNTDDSEEPDQEEGEQEGEVIQESVDRPLRPNEVPPEIVTKSPTQPEYNPDDIVTERPYFTRDRPTYQPDTDIITERPSFSRPSGFSRPKNDIITRRPTITFNNQGIVVSDNTDIVTARPSVSSHNPIYVRPDAAADTERPTFALNNQGFELDTQANTPRPFAYRPPWPVTSEKPPPLPMPDQDMNPPPLPLAPGSQNKPTVSTLPGKNQQRFPVVEVNLQDSTHRPTILARPQRPKPSPPYQYEIPERDVKPPPLPTPSRPSPFKPPTYNKDRDTDSSPSDTSIIVPQGTVESVEEERVPPRPTLRPRPVRPQTSRPIVRPSRPSLTFSSRPIRPPPQYVLEPPSPPPSTEAESPIVTEPSVETVVSIEGENKIVRTNVYEETTIRPTKTVTVFETVQKESSQRFTPSRSSYRPKSRPPYRPAVSSSSIELESSQEAWPENTKIRFTPSITATTEFVSTKPADNVKSTVVLGAGIFGRPRPSSSHKQYSSIDRDNIEIVVKPVTSVITLPPNPTTRFVTHTETLTVTSTETTVLRSRGQPVTRTVVLTQTEAPRTVVSTIVGTITEIHTIDPSTITSTILATVTTREVEVTTTVYPPGSPFDPENFPAFTVRPGDSLPPQRGDQSGESADINHGHDYEEVFELEKNEVNRAVENGAPDRPFSVDQPSSSGACQPECDVTKNELCQENEGVLRCVCRPGFARIFHDAHCTPTYTYRMRLLLDKVGGKKLQFEPALTDAASSEFRTLSGETREGVRRAAMRSELRDMFHGAAVTGFEPQDAGPRDDLELADGVMLNFYVQLSENMEESALEEKFQQSLQTTNFSLGGTEVFAARENKLQASDFDECASSQFNDCSEHAQCFNLRGTYTCSCREGYSDLSPSPRFPGRACSAELLGCEQCNFHGTCYTLGRGDDRTLCDCFQWYAGDNCNINLKALLIALVTLGAVMLLLLLVCLVLTCLKKRRNDKNGLAAGPGFMRYRGPGGTQMRGTLDKAAMLQDTSSESSGDASPLPYMTPVHQPGGGKGGRRGSKLDPSMVVHGDGSYVMEQDRSLTVMIPRAKYRPVQPASSVLSMSTFAAPDPTARPASRPGPSAGHSPTNQAENKLLSYLEGGSQDKQNSGKRKQSSSTNHTENTRKSSAPRKPSTGALVSAGFEVSAQVTRGPMRGAQGDHMTLASHRSGFTTLRTGDSNDEEQQRPQSMEDLSPATIPPPPPPPPVTVSEARSYDETLVQPPTRPLMVRGGQHGSTYGSKLGSSRNDGQTMAERDIGSTFVMPQSHLYKPARGQGSDVSNFDSL